ncbi:tumor necrosis factor receptor superfamily member 9-like isoform X2 [Syngnathoides biaculeatus]|uniref:tumor necrosis factor receptor superfamily member 9-like isoform X2 n=1 Tax=Syngnathoides biaculeatus TaxID=300417 RepID=UPI002ADE2764|nr:tumor necrosis factor receptor superfamily member 9-like isoform X2 [Syngnathoides biaculeatus]
MAAVLLLLLLSGSSVDGLQEASRGCRRWVVATTPGRLGDVCCVECHPGNRLVSDCGPDPRDLCTPCEGKTFTQNPNDYKCSRCTQCEGAQVLLRRCTATTDTRCGCKDGLACGDERCTFCREKCGPGEEPSDNRSCRPCANGTFNDQIHQKCKPRRSKCPGPDQMIVASGDAFADNKCVNVSRSILKKPALCRMKRKKKKKEKIIKPPIIRTATDDPRTLIAIECSFDEAQEEQGGGGGGGGSSDSLTSKESSRDQLVA